jgi:hypothetical protein
VWPVDGTTVPMPETAANAVPPLGLVCLGSGAIRDAAIDPYRGKGGDEQSLLRSVPDWLEHGDLLLGDTYFATYFLLCTLRERGIDGVFEQQGARRRGTDFRRGRRPGSATI